VLGAVGLFAQRIPGGPGRAEDSTADTHGVRVTRAHRGAGPTSGLLEGTGRFASGIIPAGLLPGARATETVTTENGVRVHRHH
jgi:hypothetical protein